MEIKLGDFGLATRLEYEGEKKKTICGTPNYIAPEILENKGHSYEVDIWSLGVILYTQLIGKPPFETPEVKTTYKRIKQCLYSFPDHITISEHARNLITRILVLDPSKRPTLDEIMADPFMSSEPIPKNMPRSTLACPPPNDYRAQIKS
jgi:polo-like kinase 1